MRWTLPANGGYDWWLSQLTDEARALLDAERVDGAERYFIDLSCDSRVSVTVYVCERRWGGPEEGGWYYDVLYPEDDTPSIRCANTKDAVDEALAQANAWCQDNAPRYGIGSVLGGWEHQVVVEHRRGSRTDTARPRYS